MHDHEKILVACSATSTLTSPTWVAKAYYDQIMPLVGFEPFFSTEDGFT
jgi:hypothetical protein